MKITILVLAEIMPIIQQRCVGCHGQNPVQSGIPAPPLGIVLENVQDLEAMAQRVYQSVTYFMYIFTFLIL